MNNKIIMDLMKRKTEISNKLDEDLKLLLEANIKHMERLIEKTEKKQDAKDAEQFISEILQYRIAEVENKENDDWRLKDTVSAKDLYKKYDEWRIVNDKTYMSNTAFGRLISYSTLTKKRTGKGNVYIFTTN